MEKMSFKLFEGAQRTPEWYEIRRGKISSSRLKDWLAKSSAKGKEGTFLKARFDYERELMYERQFNVNYDNFVSDAMQDGIDYEAFARQEYERITRNSVEEVGGWYSDTFFSSTDGRVTEKGKSKPTGILEVKWLRDNEWSALLEEMEVKKDHQLQCQGGMMASGLQFCDYIAGNLNTKKFIIIRIKRDQEQIDKIEASLGAPLSVDPFDLTKVHDFSGQALREDELHPAISGEQAAKDIKELGF